MNVKVKGNADCAYKISGFSHKGRNSVTAEVAYQQALYMLYMHQFV